MKYKHTSLTTGKHFQSTVTVTSPNTAFILTNIYILIAAVMIYRHNILPGTTATNGSQRNHKGSHVNPELKNDTFVRLMTLIIPSSLLKCFMHLNRGDK